MEILDAGEAMSTVTDDADVQLREPSRSGLPWAVAVRQTSPLIGPAQAQRTAQLIGLGLLVVVVAGGLFVTTRSVSRELRVARLQNDFVAAVSHEFRTPLTSLQQYTTLLNDDDALPTEKRRAFHQAQARATARLQDLVESVLDFQRMEAGARPYEFQERTAGPALEKVVADFVRQAPDDFTIDCRVDDACRAAQVRIDREAFGRAVWNLLDNAVKYSGEGRHVTVSGAVIGRDVAVAVADQGVGIPQPERRAIFAKFFRGDVNRTSGIRGTGLGLAMVQHIVRAHRGRITVDSEVGRGSTFTLWLPIIEPGTAALADREM